MMLSILSMKSANSSNPCIWCDQMKASRLSNKGNDRKEILDNEDYENEQENDQSNFLN